MFYKYKSCKRETILKTLILKEYDYFPRFKIFKKKGVKCTCKEFFSKCFEVFEFYSLGISMSNLNSSLPLRYGNLDFQCLTIYFNILSSAWDLGCVLQRTFKSLYLSAFDKIFNFNKKLCLIFWIFRFLFKPNVLNSKAISCIV